MPLIHRLQAGYLLFQIRQTHPLPTKHVSSSPSHISLHRETSLRGRCLWELSPRKNWSLSDLSVLSRLSAPATPIIHFDMLIRHFLSYILIININYINYKHINYNMSYILSINAHINYKLIIKVYISMRYIIALPLRISHPIQTEKETF